MRSFKRLWRDFDAPRRLGREEFLRWSFAAGGFANKGAVSWGATPFAGRELSLLRLLRRHFRAIGQRRIERERVLRRRGKAPAWAKALEATPFPGAI